MNLDDRQDCMKNEGKHKSSISKTQKVQNFNKRSKDQRLLVISPKSHNRIDSPNHKNPELNKSPNFLKAEKVNQDSRQKHESPKYFDLINLESNKNPEPDKPSYYLKSESDESLFSSKLDEELEIKVFQQSLILTKEKVIYKNSNKLQDRINELENKLKSKKKKISNLENSMKISQKEIDQLKIEKTENLLRCLNLTEEISKLQKFNNTLEQSNNDLERSKKDLEQNNKDHEISKNILENFINKLNQNNQHLTKSNKYLQKSKKKIKQLYKELKETYEENSQKLFKIESKIKEYKDTEEKAKIILDENKKIRNDIETYKESNESLSKNLIENSIKSKELGKLNQEKDKEICSLVNEIVALKKRITDLNKQMKSNIYEELENIRNIVLDANKYSRSCSQKLIQIDRYKFDEKYGGIKDNYSSLEQKIHELLLEDHSRSTKSSN